MHPWDESITTEITSRLPGIGVLLLGAIVVSQLAPLIGTNQLLTAILLGFILTNSTGIPVIARPGVDTYDTWLVLGIILLGALITLDTVSALGPVILILVVLVPAITIVTVELLARNVFDLNTHLGSLLAAGASICGVSAIAGVSTVIHPKHEHIAYATATILLFDAITIVLYPIIGNTLGLSGQVYGIWAGISMFSTGPVVAVGFAHSATAGHWATITKLARNALLGIVVLGYATHYARRQTTPTSSLKTIWNLFPKFVIAFLILMILGTLGVFTTAQQSLIETTSSWFFLVSFVGLGINIKIPELQTAGLIPALVILVSFVTMSTLTLAVLLVLL